MKKIIVFLAFSIFFSTTTLALNELTLSLRKVLDTYADDDNVILKNQPEILPIIERLLERKLNDCLSVEFIKNKNSLKLVVHTCKTTSKETMLTALNAIIIDSDNFSNLIDGDLNTYIDYKNSHRMNISEKLINCSRKSKMYSQLMKDHFDSTVKVDLIEFYLSRSKFKGNKKYDQKITKFFNNIDEEKIIIAPKIIYLY